MNEDIYDSPELDEDEEETVDERCDYERRWWDYGYYEDARFL